MVDKQSGYNRPTPENENFETIIILALSLLALYSSQYVKKILEEIE